MEVVEIGAITTAFITASSSTYPPSSFSFVPPSIFSPQQFIYVPLPSASFTPLASFSSPISSTPHVSFIPLRVSFILPHASFSPPLAFSTPPAFSFLLQPSS